MIALSLVLCALAAEPFQIPAHVQQPRVVDERLKLECLVAEPDLVTPTGLAVDARGRVLVIECHTHFPPPNYAGPKHDRIRIFEDTDGDGKLDKAGTFHEGTKATMSLAVYRDGTVFVATRNEIIQLWDREGDGVADASKTIVRLETAGNYPHNGLSGFAFDLDGNIYFGMGENLGAEYKLIGAVEAAALKGGGEGGNVFCCDRDGMNLRRVATGFWNPFHLTFDAFGQLFAVDNDPDSRPPCRLLHVVEGGDYGFKFRHGRKGVHPFTAWNGELPGTLPMVCGTGEAPCSVVAYESDHLPQDYVSNLLVTSWGDHRIERYALEQRGASFVSTMKPVVIGNDQFRPVGMAVAPDGSLYFSDWVDKSYQLHGKGRIWRLSNPTAKKVERPTDVWQMLLSDHGPLREQAIFKLLEPDPIENPAVDPNSKPTGRDFPPKFRGDRFTKLQALQGAVSEAVPSKRAQFLRLAMRGLGYSGVNFSRFKAEPDPRVWAALALDTDRVLALAPNSRGGGTNVKDVDPLIVATVVRGISPSPWNLGPASYPDNMLADPFVLQALVNLRRKRPSAGGHPNTGENGSRNERLAWALNADDKSIPSMLKDQDLRINFVAVRKIGEEKLVKYRDDLNDRFQTRPANRELFSAYLTTLEMLEGNKSDQFDRIADEMLFNRLSDG